MEEMLLVGVLWEISMLDRKLKGKKVHVEISLGNFGNMALEERQFAPEPVPDGMSRRSPVVM
jgi:hypothetical protein